MIELVQDRVQPRCSSPYPKFQILYLVAVKFPYRQRLFEAVGMKSLGAVGMHSSWHA